MITKTTLDLTFLPHHTTVGMNSLVGNDLQLYIQCKYLGFGTLLFMLFYTGVYTYN